MATIDELMEGKQPGEIWVCMNSDWRFRPFFRDGMGSWHGVYQDGSPASWQSDINDWQLWPPKQKVVRYLWAKKNGGLSTRLYSLGEASEHLILKDWQRLDWSATEMDE